jgi:hypothetical protein
MLTCLKIFGISCHELMELIGFTQENLHLNPQNSFNQITWNVVQGPKTSNPLEPIYAKPTVWFSLSSQSAISICQIESGLAMRPWNWLDLFKKISIWTPKILWIRLGMVSRVPKPATHLNLIYVKPNLCFSVISMCNLNLQSQSVK